MRLDAKSWSAHLEAARKEGVPLTQYAKRYGLSHKTLYNWKKKLKLLQEVVEPKRENKFVALGVTEMAGEKPVCSSLILPSGLRLEISGLPSPAWLLAMNRAAQGGS